MWRNNYHPLTYSTHWPFWPIDWLTIVGNGSCRKIIISCQSRYRQMWRKELTALVPDAQTRKTSHVQFRGSGHQSLLYKVNQADNNIIVIWRCSNFGSERIWVLKKISLTSAHLWQQCNADSAPPIQPGAPFHLAQPLSIGISPTYIVISLPRMTIPVNVT